MADSFQKKVGFDIVEDVKYKRTFFKIFLKVDRGFDIYADTWIAEKINFF